MDLAWTGPLGVRLVGPADADPDGPVPRMLEGLPGRVHHLRMEVEEPGGRARSGAGHLAVRHPRRSGTPGPGSFEIARADNAGLGIVLLPARTGPEGPRSEARRTGSLRPMPDTTDTGDADEGDESPAPQQEPDGAPVLAGADRSRRAHARPPRQPDQVVDRPPGRA